MTDAFEPTAQPTSFAVSLLPEDDINYRNHKLDVTYCGAGQWDVRHLDSASVGIDGTWSDGIKPHGRDGWAERHRFDLDTALRLAKDAAPEVTVNGITTADLLRRKQASDG